MTREEIRTATRDYLYEDTADLITDAQINKWIDLELKSLASKNIFDETIYTTSTVINQEDYALPANNYMVTKVEVQEGSTNPPDYVEINGWRQYNEAIYLPFYPTKVQTLRIHLYKKFTSLASDETEASTDDEVTEVVIMGVLLRAYRRILGYMRYSKNFDSVTLPAGLNLNALLNLYQETKKDYKDLISQHSKTVVVTSINLVA